MMRSIKSIPAAFGITGFLCTPLMADWQFTRWGDKLDQVLSYKVDNMRRASKSETEGSSIQGIGKMLATSAYRASGMTMRANYLFDGDHLSGVSVIFSTLTDAETVLIILKQTYGKPAAEKPRNAYGCNSVYYEWIDDTRRHNVTYSLSQCSDAPVSSSATFTPVKDPKDTGL